MAKGQSDRNGGASDAGTVVVSLYGLSIGKETDVKKTKRIKRSKDQKIVGQDRRGKQ